MGCWASVPVHEEPFVVLNVMISHPWQSLGAHPRQWLALIALGCAGLMAYGLYLQHVVGLEPCPMCIVQRYALLLVIVLAGVSAALKQRTALWIGQALTLAAAVFGAFVAARQSWLQWNPPEIATCGRDFYGMIEAFPLKRAIPMIFRGTGDCSKVDWTFLGLTIANWSFLCFAAIAVLILAMWWPRRSRG